jgi:uncharacterized protein (DUF1330 family)
MTRFASYLIVWGDDPATLPTRSQIGPLALAAHANDGELLALGPTHDSSEEASRSVPHWIAIARFAAESAAAGWYNEAADSLRGTALVAAALQRPPWWPPELEARRPEWSQHLDPPADRLGLLNCVWAEITDQAKFIDYSEHFKWTVELNGGVFLAAGAFPRVLGGGPGPQAIALMGWPRDEIARRTWYAGANYRPYKLRRYESSKSTTASVIALDSEGRHA